MGKLAISVTILSGSLASSNSVCREMYIELKIICGYFHTNIMLTYIVTVNRWHKCC